MYYKIIDLNKEKFIGVATSQDFRRYQTKNRIFVFCDVETAQYIECENKLYRALWMTPETSNIVDREIVDVVEIGEEEYNTLQHSIEVEEFIQKEEFEGIQQTVEVDNKKDVSLEYVIQSKIDEMSVCCRNAIYSGFSIVLSDGNEYHFSLTIQDQINMSDAASLIASGEDRIPYHADSCPFTYYSKDDMLSIIKEATRYKTYHNAYFNSLKAYINTITDIIDVSVIFYGIEVPKQYQSDILLSITNK